MQRFAPYLGVFAVLVLGAALAVSIHARPAVAPAHPSLVFPATSSSPVSDQIPAATSSQESVQATDTPISATEQTTGTLQSKTTPVPPTSGSLTTTVAPPPAPIMQATTTAVSTAIAPPPLSSSGDAALDASAAALRNALVNILCDAPAGGAIHSISGSGVFVDPKGIILTNAHVAQYFLLADRDVSCSIRTGGPAKDAYRAALIYIPAAWIKQNASVITQAAPDGTGENDFALLAVTGSATNDPLPASFPFVPPAVVSPAKSTPVVIASYGAQFLQTSQVRTDLYPTIVFGSVKDVFTFATDTVDVLSLGGSAAAQEGSSGGGVATAAGTLAGAITTSTITGATDTRTLNAITASYIRAAYASQTGEPLDLLLARPTGDSIAAFAPKISALESVITANL